MNTIDKNVVAKLVAQLNVSEETATSMVKQEIARKVAGEKYRQSEAYKLRLAQQKAVRAALKQAVV